MALAGLADGDVLVQADRHAGGARAFQNGRQLLIGQPLQVGEEVDALTMLARERGDLGVSGRCNDAGQSPGPRPAGCKACSCSASNTACCSSA